MENMKGVEKKKLNTKITVTESSVYFNDKINNTMISLNGAAYSRRQLPGTSPLVCTTVLRQNI